MAEVKNSGALLLNLPRSHAIENSALLEMQVEPPGAPMRRKVSHRQEINGARTLALRTCWVPSPLAPQG